MNPAPDSSDASSSASSSTHRALLTEDWSAVLLAVVVLCITFGVGVLDYSKRPTQSDAAAETETGTPPESENALAASANNAKSEAGNGDDSNGPGEEVAPAETPQASDTWSHPLKSFYAKPGTWTSKPWIAFKSPFAVVGAFFTVLLIGLIGGILRGRRAAAILPGLLAICLLATLAYVLAGQSVVKNYNLEYALWALLVGLVISNTVGTPGWLKHASMTELYIKTGLVLLGAEVLFGRLVELGIPGVCVAWIVTPIVLITTFWFGQKILKIESPSLNMVISADMSVCGVSAAIATAASCKAKKEELSAAIGMSLSFTVLMMVVMPLVIGWLDLSPMLAGAWLGGTIDSTGAVAVAGELLTNEESGDLALKVATTVKMIQNILIGVVAFGVAYYWVQFQEPGEETTLKGADASGAKAIGIAGLREVWRRFPRFVLGFLCVSIVFSLFALSGDLGQVVSENKGVTKTLRGWLFCLAFISIGLDSNFRTLAQQFGRGKPVVLYAVGQTLNIGLTFAMAWLVFEKLYPMITQDLSQ